jgi:choline oxidase
MAEEFDYVGVGGSSAGVGAARLSEDPSLSVCVLEWGPADVGNDDVLQIRRLADDGWRIYFHQGTPVSD